MVKISNLIAGKRRSEDPSRRKFLKTSIAFAAGAGILSLAGCETRGGIFMPEGPEEPASDPEEKDMLVRGVTYLPITEGKTP